MSELGTQQRLKITIPERCSSSGFMTAACLSQTREYWCKVEWVATGTDCSLDPILKQWWLLCPAPLTACRLISTKTAQFTTDNSGLNTLQFVSLTVARLSSATLKSRLTNSLTTLSGVGAGLGDEDCGDPVVTACSSHTELDRGLSLWACWWILKNLSLHLS